MPVVIVTAPPLGAPQTADALSALNTAIAAALALPPDAVHSMLVPALAAATGSTPCPAWPTAVLHGSARPAAAMQDAERRAAAALAAAWHTGEDHVWVQWQVRATS